LNSNGDEAKKTERKKKGDGKEKEDVEVARFVLKFLILKNKFLRRAINVISFSQ